MKAGSWGAQKSWKMADLTPRNGSFGGISAVMCGKCVIWFTNTLVTFYRYYLNTFMDILFQKIFFVVYGPPLPIFLEIWRWQFMLYWHTSEIFLEYDIIDLLYMKRKLGSCPVWCNLNKHDRVSRNYFFRATNLGKLGKIARYGNKQNPLNAR